MSLETRETKHFWRDIPGFCRDIPGFCPKRLRKKVCVRFSFPISGPSIIWSSGCETTLSNQDFHCLLQDPWTPEGFRRVPEGGSEGVSEVFFEGFFGRGPRLTPSKTLQKPFRDPF